MRTSLIASLLSLALTVPNQATAQSAADSHSGFHASIGLGGGSVGTTCTGCGSDRESSLALMLRFGGAVAPGVVLSGELTGWSKVLNGATVTTSWANFVAQLYPNPAEGFYVKGGIGVASLQAVVPGFTSTAKVETTSLGLVGGIGYDIRLSKGFSLTPFADFLWAADGDAKVNGGSSGVSIGANMVHVGMAASWR